MRAQPGLLASASLLTLSLGATALQADVFHNVDGSIIGSLCVGEDCVTSETFEGGVIALRLKQNNMVLRFDDSSSPTGTFPSNDWQFRINSNLNNGPSFFVIDDVTAGTAPFTIVAGAPTNALYVASTGYVGLGTSTPLEELHILDGDTPTIRLDQDGTKGYPAQVWDIGANDGNFFIRDRTADPITRPVRIVSGAPENSLHIAANGNVALAPGTGLGYAPAVPLHILRADGTAGILVEDTGTSNGNLSMLQLTNRSGRARMQFTSEGNANQTGDWSISSGLTFVLQERLGGKNVFIMDNAGNLAITGELTTAGSCAAGCDRVFDADYKLPSIAEHQAAMWQNGYLPNVGPTAEDAPFNVSDKMGRMLNELEHAHIFIGQQERRIEAQDSRIAALEAKLEALLAR